MLPKGVTFGMRVPTLAPPSVQISQVAPGLFLGGAVAAGSHHLLAHLGITHVVNATEVGLWTPFGSPPAGPMQKPTFRACSPVQELLLPPSAAGFEVLRVPLRDTPQEDIALHFNRVRGVVPTGDAMPPVAFRFVA